ncbi:MAG: ribosomal protein S18-alanine N-acetyltransferase [Pseudomonadales bacterium]|nr:ribosomal protein S18-alanine N-acetyltransferase [Pseudomonadales bacterium]
MQSGEISFRRMRSKDLDTVMRNETRSYAFPWTLGIFMNCIASGYECSVMLQSAAGVAAKQQGIIGHSVLSVAAGEAHLLNVCVSRDHHSNGYGRQLVVYMLEQARSQAVDVVFLEVRPSNLVAIELYDSLGFNEIGVRKDYYPAHIGHEDALVMALQLNLG